MVGKRNFGLDVARAISIILVLISHLVDLELEVGIVGVQIFFILSGFLIGQILIKDFSSGGTFSTVTNFWKRRWYRTLPLYYLVLTLRIFFYGNPYGWKIIVYYLFLQANFLGIGFFTVSWSLVVEEWFYIFLPIAILLFFRKGIEPKRFLNFLVLLIIAIFITRFLWNYFNKGVIIYQFDCLLVGVLLALLKIHYNHYYKKLNSAVFFLFGLTGIILLTFLLGDLNTVVLYDPFFRVTWYMLISICIFFVIPYVEQSRFFNESIRRVRGLYFFFTWTSILTYSIYLIHMEVFFISFDIWYPVNLAIQLLALYGISFVIYALFEHPMMSLRDNLSFRQYLASVRSFSFNV